MNLANTVRELGRPRVLVVGDLVLDHYVFGTVGRISPEAPIGVLKVSKEESRPGCAGAVAVNLAVLGAEVRLFGWLGADEDGEEFLDLSTAADVDTLGILRIPDRPTFRKTRFIAMKGAGGQQVLRVDREETSPLPDEHSKALEDALMAAMEGTDLLVFSDYRKGTLTAPLLRAGIVEGHRRGVPVLVDPKPPDYFRYRGATVVTPNRPETEAHVGFPVVDDETAHQAAAKLREDLELDAAVITLDKDGIYLSDREGHDRRFPVEPKEVFDITGCGDMVMSTLAMCIAAGASYPDAVEIANVAASIEVGRLGVVPVTREEILESLHGGAHPTSKRRDLLELLDILTACRQRGEKVVFTNGCFDVLHAGHIRLLKASKKEGDVLVVGLNSDASIRRLKGEERPVTKQADRVEVLSELAAVDHIVVFDGDTPLPEIEALLPDVLVKGEDWRGKGVVGQEVVEAAGGKVVLVPLLPGLSSTKIINRMREER